MVSNGINVRDPLPHISFTTLGSRSAKHTRQSAGLSAPAQSLRAWNPISGADLKPTGIPRDGLPAMGGSLACRPVTAAAISSGVCDSMEEFR